MTTFLPVEGRRRLNAWRLTECLLIEMYHYVSCDQWTSMNINGIGICEYAQRTSSFRICSMLY